jgi:hypothetical protein
VDVLTPRHPEFLTTAVLITAMYSIPFLQSYLSMRRRRARGEKAVADNVLMGVWITVALFFDTLELTSAFAP